MISDKAQKKRIKTKDVFICYVSNSEVPYKDPQIEKLSKNHAEFHILDLTYLKQKAGSAENLNSALSRAKRRGCKYLLYVEVGNVIDWADGITEYIQDVIEKYNDDIQFIGHILQHKNGSFFIHPQFCLFDVEWALRCGITYFSTPQSNSIAYCYNRSEENFHDHYTPLWVTPTKEKKRFKSLGLGANILNAIAETNSKAGIWPKEVREKKKFVYPTVSEEIAKHKYIFLNEFDTQRAYVGNTEVITPDRFSPFRSANIQRVFTPASGLNTFLIGFYSKSNRVVAYDISIPALNMIQQYIDHWDGTNYKEFFFDVIAPSNITRTFYKATGSNLDRSQRLLESLGGEWTTWWRNNKNNFSVTSINLFDQYTWHKFKPQGKTTDVPTLLNVSNIYHYAPTATFFSIQERIQLIKNLKEYLVNKVMSEENLWVTGMNPATGQYFSGERIKDFDLVFDKKFAWR